MRASSLTFPVLAEPGFEHLIAAIGVGPDAKEGDPVIFEPGFMDRLAHMPARKIGVIAGPPVEGYHPGILDTDPMPAWMPVCSLRSVVDPAASRAASIAEYLRECAG